MQTTRSSNSKDPRMSPSPIRPTDAELEILHVLWERGPCTVRQVHDVLSQKRELGYTTVLKQMQIMSDKELVLRDEAQRSHVYRSKQKKELALRHLVKDLMVRAFGGSPEKLVMQALAAKKTSAAEIAEIRKMLDELEKK